MPDTAAERPAVFTIPAHRSFADSLAAGLIQKFGKDPLALARGRKLYDKRNALAEREAERDMERAVKDRGRDE